MTLKLSKDSCIGILGDGQLGRMLITNGIAPLGYRAAVLGPGGRNSPAGQVAWWAKAWEPGAEVSQKLLNEFGSLVTVVLSEWENVPCELVDHLTKLGVPVFPGSKVLRVAQDRHLEKLAAIRAGILVAEYRLVDSTPDHRPNPDETVPYDSILKTRRDGYDGKGQIHLKKGELLEPAWEKLNRKLCILERKIDFIGEVSVIVARSQKWLVTYGPFENTHRDGILCSTTYPIRPSTFLRHTEDIRFATTRDAVALSHNLNAYGLLAVEFFVARDGTLIFNEMAPRPHNSGHGTMSWCETDQFEQYVRAALNLPMGECQPYRGGTMFNVLGDSVLLKVARLQNGSFVEYGKVGHDGQRKMGHQTVSELLQAR